jgi:hypothetical protein
MENKNIIIVWKADRVILNSVFDFPPDRTIITFPPQDVVHKSKITARSKMTFFDGELTITFDDNKVSISQYCQRQWDETVIVYYLIYKTFIYYNCLMPIREESTEVIPEVDRVVFQLHRYVTKYIEEDGNNIPYVDTEPCELVLNKKDIADYLMFIDQTIRYAICYYLLGCNTQQYFLIEFYKCLEVIKNHFGTKEKMVAALKPYGFIEKVYKESNRLANDQMKPLSIARHAPREGISVQSINMKWLFSDPVGRKAFETGEEACRNTIDAYLKFRVASNEVNK